jgi:stage V sporulation protein AC
MEASYKKKLIKKHTPHSRVLRDCGLAFLFGGLICTLGELLFMLYSYIGFDSEKSGMLVTVSLIFLGAFVTALGFFDNIARYSGAGTLVPVTGFANAVTSEAMDSRSEGLVTGIGVKIFNVAGPVILYGILSGVLYGIIYYVYTLMQA